MEPRMRRRVLELIRSFEAAEGSFNRAEPMTVLKGGFLFPLEKQEAP